MKKFQDVKNQWALSVWFLIQYKSSGFTMKEAMQDYFHKIQTRLGEVEKGRKSDLKLRRLPMTLKNRFGHTCTVTHYKSLAPMPYLKNLFNKLNKQGKKALHK